MIFFWLGIFFFTSMGTFLYPIYGMDNSGGWPILLGVGIVSNIIGCYRTRMDSLSHINLEGDAHSGILRSFIINRQSSILFVIPLGIGIYAFCFPYSLPLYVWVVAILLEFFLRWRCLSPICSGVLLSGLILVFQTACIIPYSKLAARLHEINLFTPFFYWIFKGLGVPCAFSQDAIFVQTTQANLTLVASWEKLGLFFLINFFVGAMVSLCLVSNWFGAGSRTGLVNPRSCWWMAPGRIFLILVSFIIVRYIFLSLIYIDIVKVEIFWEPIIVAGSFLPLPFLLWRFIDYRSQPSHPSNSLLVNRGEGGLLKSGDGWSLTRGRWYLGIACLLFSFSLVSYFGFHDPGRLKSGRIVIDEFHSNWEWTDRRFDTRWFGIQSVYNYYCFADYLNHFYSIERLKKGITEDRLKGCDVLIIKTPTSPFTGDEIDTIVRFVKAGGGLFLIGDHTNVFGTSMNINPLAERFGIRFNYDATYDLRTNDLHLHEHNRLFRHPVVKDMPYFLFATSCSLSAPLLAEDVMIASNLKTIYLDYSRGGYFPDKNTERNFTFGLFLQSVGTKYGKGRVLTFSDSTCFSNFYMQIPGKPEYVLGSINWLNRMNHYDYPIKVIFFCVMAISLGFIVCYLLMWRKGLYNEVAETSRCGTEDDRGKKTVVGGQQTGICGEKIITGGSLVAATSVTAWGRAYATFLSAFHLQHPTHFVSVLLFGGLLGVSAATLFVNYMADRHYYLPKAHTPMIKVGFEEEYCDFKIHSRQLLHEPAMDYQTFYVWSQRLGYYPTLFSLNDSPDTFDMIILVNPLRYFSETEIKKIEDYIARGGRLLVVDHPKGARSTANQIIERFGMKIRHGQHQDAVEIYEGDTRIGTLKSFAPVEGGKALLYVKDKGAFVSTEKFGMGIIAAMAASPSFANNEMGETEAVPDEHQRFLYRLEFWILSSLIEGRFEPFSNFTVRK